MSPILCFDFCSVLSEVFLIQLKCEPLFIFGTHKTNEPELTQLEAIINCQINLEPYASHAYFFMSYYLDYNNAALQCYEEREHTEKFIKFQHNEMANITSGY